ncbi:MAG: hypothetical protein L0Z46_12930 [Nitrospiraceae bacterium]|nr:hypothetical protein [Nitrospiraceae bacterium]
MKRLDELRAKVEQFDGFLHEALRQKYTASYPPEAVPHLLRDGVIPRWNLSNFLETYTRAGVYPPDRLERLVYQLFDIKLQLYYLLEIDIGLYNRLVHERGYDDKNPAASPPHVFLTRLSLDQALIGKSRILWERVMNFVYYLETGEDLDRKVSNRRSKKQLFFRFVESSARWRFLAPYGDVIEQYDSAYRTPEYHKSSVLRAELLGSISVDPGKLLELINKAINNLWENILSIVSGGKAISFNELHLDASGKIRAEYLG